jgi:uncharacterized repeat protein (TIGR03803 family)
MRASRLFVAAFASSAVFMTLLGVSAAQMKVLYNFNGTIGSNPPEIALTQGRDGQIYGTASLGGISGLGSIFKITTDGQVTALHDFSGSDGQYPEAGLTLGADGNFYGTTEEGGTGSWGVLFKMSPAGAVTILHNFNQDGVDGFLPLSSPILASDGNFYGATSYGGTNNAGTVYKLTPAGVYTTIYNYDSSVGYGAGFSPTQGRDGNLYVVAISGGSDNCGSIIKISTSGVLLNSYSFDCGANGGNPQASLLQASDGNFYGAAFNGGSYSGGVLFKVDTNFDYTVLESFGATTADGSEPNGGLIQATDGKFYGVFYKGGAFNDGAIYSYSIGGVTNALFSWNRQIDAEGTFLQHTNGALYGMTYVGGSKNLGTVYSFSHGLKPFVAFVRPSGKVASTAQILGQGLTGATSVTFNGVPATSFSVVRETYMTAVVPSGATTGPVVVTTPGGALTSNVSFRIIN